MMSRLIKGVSVAALLAGVSLTGCGSGDEDSTSAFVGTYMYLSGTRTLTCGANQQVDQLSGPLTVSKGIDAPLVVLLGSCTLKLDPVGNSATLRPGQVCPVQNISIGGAPATETDTHNGGNLVVTGNAATIAESGSAQLVDGTTGQTLVCTFTMNGTLNKVSR
jgi:hypothetical protein